MYSSFTDSLSDLQIVYDTLATWAENGDQQLINERIKFTL